MALKQKDLYAYYLVLYVEWAKWLGNFELIILSIAWLLVRYLYVVAYSYVKTVSVDQFASFFQVFESICISTVSSIVVTLCF